MAGTTDWAVAAKKAAAWGTAVALGAGDGLKITSETISEGIPEEIKDENVGDSLSQGTYQGNVTVAGNMNLGVRYQGIERLLAMFCAADVVTEVEAGLVYLHSMIFQPSNVGKFMTVAFDKGTAAVPLPHEYPTAKLAQIELGHADGKLMFTPGWVPNRCERNAPTNNGAAIRAATFPTLNLLALFNQLDFYFKLITGAEGNLVAGDKLKVAECKFSANRQIKGDHVSSSGGEIDEPDTDGLPEASLTLNFPRYSAALDALIKPAQIVQTDRLPLPYKAQAVWTGPLITGTAAANKYLFAIDLPRITIRKAPPNAANPGSKVPIQMEMSVSTPQAAANGSDWAWVVAGSTPFRIRVQNTNSASMA